MKKAQILLLAILALFNLSGATYGQDLTAQLLDQGLKLYAAKDYRGASDYLGQVVDMSPDHNQARYYLIYSLTSSGNLELALKHAKILVQKNPGQKQYASLITQIEKALADQRKKREESRRVAPIPQEVTIGGYKSKDVMQKPRMSSKPAPDPVQKELSDLEKAVYAIDEERFASATSLLNAIVKKEPQNAKAYHYLGVIDFNSGNYAKAEKFFEKALKIDPNSFESCFLLGDSYRKQEDFVNAEKTFNKALQIKEDVFAMLNLAESYMSQNKLNEAEKAFERVVKKDPQITEGMMGLAEIKLSRGFPQDATAMVNKVLSEDSKNPEAHFLKSRILVDNQLYEDAVGELQAANTISPTNTKYRSFLAQALVKSFNIPKGLELAGALLKENPDNVEARLALAEGLILSGAFGDAQEHLDLAEKKFKHPQVSYLRAQMAIKDGENDKARQYFVQYIQRSVGRPKAYKQYADFLKDNGYASEAIQAYEEIAEQFPGTSFAKASNDLAESLRGTESGSNSSKPNENSSENSKYRSGKVKF